MQTKLKATPGPWTIGSTSDIAQEVRIDAMRGDPDIGCTQWESFAVCYGEYDRPDFGMEKARANAQLMTAAPDLLEFAQEWLDSQGTDENYMTAKARALIAKARGEQLKRET